MPKTLLKYSLLFLAFALIYAACEKIPENKIWPVDTSNDKEQPVITKVYPDPSSMDDDSVAFAAVGYIYIEGQGFSATPEENRVFFNGERGDVVSASPTKLKVKLPNVVGDSIKVHVSVKGALLFAKYKTLDYYFPFRAKSVVKSYKAIDKFIDASGLAVDKDDNVYVLTTAKKILKLTDPDSTLPEEYGTSIFITTPCMRFGPDGSLYLTRGTKSIYKVPPGGGKAKRWVSAPSYVSFLDFDENQNLYAGGKGGEIDIIHPDKSKMTGATYTDYYISSLRVYNGYVYISAEYRGDDSTQIQQGIWKNKILDANGNLGANELVVNWTDLMGKEGPNILSITFDEDGEMYIGLDKENAVYLLNKKEYWYSEVLVPPATVLTWGNGKYLYINKHAELPDDRQILRVELSKKGAIYYGRPQN
ncbi:hypothetical protein DRI50_08220 [candidate division KSB1 bacterium]|nr:MAG: hypothetical protein DRI50_08220 [candidate division KSB1 bacterium]